MRGLLLAFLLSIQGFALDMDDIRIMRDSNVLIAFPSESKAHIISNSMKPAELMKVNYLKLNGQSLRKIPAWLPKMTNIVKLELQDTNMDLIDLSVLRSLTHLNTLNLSNNKKLFDKGGSLNEVLSAFTLSELYLANTGGSSSSYTNIGDSKSIIKLDLSDNAISSIDALHLERLHNLKELKIVGNRISGTLDTAYLPKHSLTYLNLSHNNISRLKFSDDFPALKSLHISNNKSYLEFDEDWDDAYILKQLSDGSFNDGVALPKSIMKRLGIKSKWITPTKSICRANGGEMSSSGVCQAEWIKAKTICSASGGRLPTIEEFREVISGCGGTNVKYGDENWSELWDKNNVNTSYQSCYKAKGFSTSDFYWSSSVYESGEKGAWSVLFEGGSTYYNNKSNDYYVCCVRGRQ